MDRGNRCRVRAAIPQICDELIEKILEVSKTVKFGSALDPEIYMGPVISVNAKQKIENYIDLGVKGGARLILDGRSPQMPDAIKNGYYVGPTIFADFTPEMTISKDEIFGPVFSIVKINHIDEVLDLIRKQEFGNSACIFTQNLYYTGKFVNQANVGMIGVNVGIPAPHPYLPFGGIKNSHLGTNKVQGKDGIDFFTQNKIATIRFAPPQGSVDYGDEAQKTDSKTAQTPGVRSCVAS
jgi:malonate-semialdehyde dehydrogenase (acetylating)/methylmalonate-semialdehyde dehydrogenase